MSNNELYSIGEMAQICGVSTQALRNYCDQGIIIPEYISPDTGYRYFSYGQIPDIDRTCYLLKCGLRLSEIKDILHRDSIDELTALLDKHEAEKKEELLEIQETLNRIAWYKEYFSPDVRKAINPKQLSIEIKTFPERYLITVPCYSEDSYEEYHIRLYRTCHSPEYKKLYFKRQFCILLDYNSLMQGQIIRKHIGMYIQNMPINPSKEILEHLTVIPAGEYLCCRTQMLSDEWDPHPIQTIFKHRNPPAITLANEYEVSFQKYDHSIIELQMSI